MDCPDCGLINPDTAIRCDCGYDFGPKALKSKGTYRFKTLLVYGNLILGLGWFIFVLGIFGIIAGIAAGLAEGHPEYLALSGLGFIFGINGLLLVVSGQLISCFVAIEKNTRTIYDVLRQRN